MSKPAISDTEQRGEHTTTTPDRHTVKGQRECNGIPSNDNEETPWETQVGWIYAGHGEWVQRDPDTGKTEHGSSLGTEPEWIQKWLRSNDPDIARHFAVQEGGYPNRWGARVQVESRWNLEHFERLLEGYEDKEVVEWLRYGWPAGRLPTLPQPSWSATNHKGATDFPEQLDNYINKEKSYNAVMGPFNKIPFSNNTGISPLSTRPKKMSTERRVILDLSFPIGDAVNDGIPKDTYLGFMAKLTFPKTDDFAVRIFQLGKGSLMFKIDLSRYFRQIPLDPADYSLIGYVINGEIYFDKVLPMGLRSAPYIAQRITNAIAYIHRQLQFFLLNYVDDFVGAELKDKIWQTYSALTQTLVELGVETSKDKIVPPTTRLEFLGITFDSNKLTMEISDEKMMEIRQELHTWLHRSKARRREVESLIGKLQFMAKCVRAGRIFLSRLIQWIRIMNRSSSYGIPLEARKDIAWWARFAQEYNGVSLLWLAKEPVTDTVVQTDACLTGYGGICGTQYFRGRFPHNVQHKNIAILEIWAVMVGLKIWAKQLQGKYFWIHVDNEAVATVLNTRASREPELQNTLSEIALIAAKNQFVIKARHIMGVDNRVPDWLSRWRETQAKREFRKFFQDKSLTRIYVDSSWLQYNNKW